MFSFWRKIKTIHDPGASPGYLRERRGIDCLELLPVVVIQRTSKPSRIPPPPPPLPFPRAIDTKRPTTTTL